MKKDVLLKRLEIEGANEETLSACGVEYIIHNVSDEAGVWGYAVVKVEEGNLLIPYKAVIPSEGYEQFDIENARMIDKEAIELIYDELKSKLASFEKKFLS